MKKVLVVAYLFPPAGSVGVYRTLKFIKYLPQYGWTASVVAPKNGKYQKIDEDLLTLVPADVKVHRVSTIEPFTETQSDRANPGFWGRVRRRLHVIWAWGAIPDFRVGWVLPAAMKTVSLVKNEGFTHVYISGKPFSSFLVGWWVRRLTKAHLVIDYRDPWTQNLNYERRSPLHHWVEKRMEAGIVRASSCVISNTRYNDGQMYAEFGGRQPREAFTTIHNGFDREDFQGRAPVRGEKFTITYAGVFYYSIGSDFASGAGNEVMRTYSPLYFFEALEHLFARRPELKDHFEVRFMGQLGSGYDPIIEKHGLTGVVNRLGYLDYEDHLNELVNAHALLLVLSRGEKSRGWIPSKFFQYMGSGNPILGMVPEGEVRDIIAETNAGQCVDPDDAQAASHLIEEMYETYFVNGQSLQRNESEVDKYERRHQAELLAQALSGVTER